MPTHLPSEIKGHLNHIKRERIRAFGSQVESQRIWESHDQVLAWEGLMLRVLHRLGIFSAGIMGEGTARELLFSPLLIYSIQYFRVPCHLASLKYSWPESLDWWLNHLVFT